MRPWSVTSFLWPSGASSIKIRIILICFIFYLNFSEGFEIHSKNEQKIQRFLRPPAHTCIALLSAFPIRKGCLLQSPCTDPILTHIMESPECVLGFVLGVEILLV